MYMDIIKNPSESVDANGLRWGPLFAAIIVSAVILGGWFWWATWLTMPRDGLCIAISPAPPGCSSVRILPALVLSVALLVVAICWVWLVAKRARRIVNPWFVIGSVVLAVVTLFAGWLLWFMP